MVFRGVRKMNRVFAFVVAATVFSCGGVAMGELLHSVEYAETADGAWFSSETTDCHQIDSFALNADADIDTVGWWGIDLNEWMGLTPVNPTQFRVSFYADDPDAGLPSDTLYSTTLSDTIIEMDTGMTLQGLKLYEFSATLPSSFRADAGRTYWIEICDPTTNTNWFWASGAGSDDQHVALIRGDWHSLADDLTLTLAGTVIPEPATALMLSIACVGLLARRRRA